jgi:RNA polymerase sigma-70 factor (ECF subfamily)
MTADSPGELDDTNELMCRLDRGDRSALNELFERHRERLRLMVRLRLDRRLQGRLDPSDVLQEAYLEAVARLDDYRARQDMPFFLWLRFLTNQRLAVLHRRHLHTHLRDARREISIDAAPSPEASSAVLAAHLVGSDTGPGEAAVRAERQEQLQRGLDAMDPLDREILALRHFEQLSNADAARVLGLSDSAASHRYARALLRLKDLLIGLPAFRPESRP